MKQNKIASINIDENDSILTNTYDYVSDKGIKIKLNAKSEITSLTIPSNLKNLDELEEHLIQAINHANSIVKETIQNLLIKELIKQDPQLSKEFDHLTMEDNKKS